MDMQAGAGFPLDNFRRESYYEIFLMRKIADNPFGDKELIGGFPYCNWQEFDFVLLVGHAIEGETPHLGMAVFNFTAGGSNHAHTPCAEILEFCERA